MRKKNVAIIIGSLKGGGAERVAGLLSIKLSTIYHVYLFVMDTSDVVYPYSGIIVPMDEANNGEETTVTRQLTILKRKYYIDVAISFLDTLNLANIKSSMGDKVVISSRCSYTTWITPKSLLEEEIKKWYPLADNIIACSNGIRQELSDIYGITQDSINVIYNFFNDQILKDESCNEDRSFINFVSGKQYFISVGRLDRQKNHDTLIREYDKFLNETGEDVKLVILGNGKQQGYLEDLIKDLKLEKKVKIFPYCKNPLKYVAAATAFFLPSNYEGFPNVILEAFLMGVPVIASDCMSGPREMLLDEKDYHKRLSNFIICPRGILVGKKFGYEDFKDADFKRAMKWVMENPDVLYEMGLACRKYMDNYDNSEIKKQWIAAIEDAHMNVERDFAIKQVRKEMESAEYIYIYGAGQVAGKVYEQYHNQYSIAGFIVSKRKDNINEFKGIKIYEERDVSLSNENVVVVVGVGLNYWDEVYEMLKRKGCKNIIVP